MLTQIISNITGAFTEIMSSMTSAIASGFDSLIWTETAEGVRELSSVAQFGLCFIGLGLAVGLVWFVVGLIRK